MKTISLKTKWVSMNAWRGYEQPLTAVAGANDTGMWSDSPCRSDVAALELGYVKKELRKAGISYKSAVCRTSNVFCVHRYLCVHLDDRDQARAIVMDVLNENVTDLLYLTD